MLEKRCGCADFDPNIIPTTKHQISVLENIWGSSTEISSHKLDDSDVDSDETRLNTPEKDFDPDATLSYSYKASDKLKEVDSDATRLDTPQSVTENVEVLSDTI